MCVYVSNSTSYDICLAYSNSVCELLILRLHKPALIIILMYRPPTCSPEDFNDIIIIIIVMYLYSASIQ